MALSSQYIAEAAGFRSFANGFLREIDPGIRVRHALTDGPPAPCVEWTLRTQRAAIRAEIAAPSLCGAQGFGRLWTRQLHEPRWRAVAPLTAIQQLLHEAYARVDGRRDETTRERELELIGRIHDSYGETLRQLRLAESRTDDAESFIAAERSLVFGHWLHPTPKSRRGLSLWQARAYGPEEAGRFQLTVFAVDAAQARHDSAGAHGAPQIARELLGGDAGRLPLRSGEIALPMHPLQAEALMLEPHVQALVEAGTLRHLGSFGPRFTATSSLRTVYCEDSAWMAKFSLPVTLTNSLRVNRLAELQAGVAMTRLMKRTRFSARFPQFRIVADPAYLTVSAPGRVESGFETVFRDNPFRHGGERGIAALAALTAEPLPGRPSRLEGDLRRLAKANGMSLADAARQWFRRYLDCMLEPVVALYDEHGIALEAHQQNALLDVSEGWPSCGYYRDNQGFYLAEEARHELVAHAPETAAIEALYFPEREIRRRLAYYLVVNQVFSVIARIGHDGILREERLLDDLAARLEAMAGRLGPRGRAFVRSVLDGPTLCTKANLRLRLSDRDELAAGDGSANYIDMPNPLAWRVGRGEADHALAS
jgi:spermidine-citrate ligase